MHKNALKLDMGGENKMQCWHDIHLAIRNIWHQRKHCLRYIRVRGRRKWSLLERRPMKLLQWLTVIILGGFAIFSMLAQVCEWGEAGYTAFGSLFTALAFACMISTILLQRAELQEQRKELRAQRRELEGQKKELEIQNRTAQLQRFENSFFHLLEGFKKTVEEIRSKKYPTLSSFSKDFLVYHVFENNYREYIGRMNFQNSSAMTILSKTLHSLPSLAKRFCMEYYIIINFIVNHEAFRYLHDDRFSYIKIVNLSLTNSEYEILFYYSIVNSNIDIVNNNKLFTFYSLQNNSHTPLEPWHILFFEPSAFGVDYEEYICKNGLEGKTLADFL